GERPTALTGPWLPCPRPPTPVLEGATADLDRTHGLPAVQEADLSADAAPVLHPQRRRDHVGEGAHQHPRRAVRGGARAEVPPEAGALPIPRRAPRRGSAA